MMEQSLIGADVLPAAAHLTLTLLATAHPTVTFEDTRIAKVGLGEHPISLDPLLGSLDLLSTVSTPSLWGAGRTSVGGRTEKADTNWKHPSFDVNDDELDLAIMNPPFVRNTKNQGGAAGVFLAAFAAFGIPTDVRKRMGTKLERLRKQKTAVGNGHAGLGSDFAGLAYRKTRPGGTIALVLPDSFLALNSWKKARRLLLRVCDDPLVVTHTQGNRSFSADTGMAEVLVVARKPSGPTSSSYQEKAVTCVTLTRRPVSLVEATATARAIEQISGQYGTLRVGDTQVGLYMKSRRPAITSHTDTALAATWLENGRPTLPRGLIPLNVPVCELGELGEIGPDSSAIGYSIKKGTPTTAHTRKGRYAGPFRIDHAQGVSTYPALWQHNTKSQTTMKVHPDSDARPHPGEESRAADVWARSSGRLHYNMEFRLNSQRLAACLTDPCIGGRSWPTFFPRDHRWEKALCLWANTTLGLVGHWWVGSLQHKGRSQLSILRVSELPTLDCRKVTSHQLDSLDSVFNDFEHRSLLPAHQAWQDPTRQALDKAVLETLYVDWSKITDSLDTLRLQWCEEPTVHGHKNTGQPPTT